MAEHFAIWDIDNCIADDHGRTHLIDWKLKGDARYANYNQMMEDDLPVNTVHFDFISRYATPVFLTGRPEAFRAATLRWLYAYFKLEKPWLFMRPDGTDGLTPRKLKEQQLLRQVTQKVCSLSQVVGAFDDIPAVIEMYRGYGLPACLLQANSDLSKTYSPKDLK